MGAIMKGTPKPICVNMLGQVSAIAALMLLVAMPALAAWVPVNSQSEGTLPEWRVLSSTPGSTVIEFTMNGYWSESIRENGLDYARLVVPGDHGITQKVGWPELPTISKLVGLPPTGEVSVQVRDVDFVTLNTKAIFPTQTPLREHDVRVGFDRDDAAYRSASIYPGAWAEVEDTGIWRDLRISFRDQL
jgi:hypothetical protein